MGHVLAVKQVTYGYNGEREVLRDVSLTFQPGFVTGILGPNGSGKTTLLRIMSGSIRPKPGTVRLDGQDVSEMRERELARRIALVPQRTHVEFDFTVLDIVLMGRNPHIRRFAQESEQDIAIAREAMQVTGVAHLEGRSVTALSGGELQRVVIARALAQRTGVILLDEPVSNLDIKHQVEVLALVRKLAHEQQVAAVCVLHDLSLAAHYCDRLALFENGGVRCFGSPRDVLTNENVESVYGVPVEVMEDASGRVRVAPVYS